MNSISISLGREGWRYAQEKGGQKLHTVEDHGDGWVSRRAVCGREPGDGTWRMTINVPMGMACRNCRRIGIGNA